MTISSDSERLSPKELYEALASGGIDYFCGVPDSLLSAFGWYLQDHVSGAHDIAVNEGSAVALAIGYHVATSKLPLVYMQNSGLGNAINPLVSLADPLIMSIPIILLIGWRGKAGKKDEPQHQKQGLITTDLLTSLDIPYAILSSSASTAGSQITEMTQAALKSKRPYALLVADDVLGQYKRATKLTKYALSREEAVGYIADSLATVDIMVATTGKMGRELFEYREKKKQNHTRDLLVVGGMGHASTIAMAIAQQKSAHKVYCIDGDGALLMHMGSMATIGSKGLKNFYHFVINNGAHESVGGQPTVGFDIDMPAIARACGYKHAIRVSDRDSLVDTLKTIEKLDGPVFIEVRVNTKSRAELSRPTIHPSKNKEALMTFLNES